MNYRKCTGFTLGELCAVLLILSVVAAILFPVFAKTRDSGRNRGGCHSNMKQIELALIEYIQDYDETFPPCAQPIDGEKTLVGWAVPHDYAGTPVAAKSANGNGDPLDFGLLFTYTKNGQIFRCPEAARDSGPLSYMYNDLAAGVGQKEFAAVASTVLVCDGEDLAGNVGHSYEQNTLPANALFARDGTVYWGATMQTAPLRHNDGANYGYADGHVKWSEPRKIFFPSRLSASRSHKDTKTGQIFGPDPAKLNTEQAAHTGTRYAGTFHIN